MLVPQRFGEFSDSRAKLDLQLLLGANRLAQIVAHLRKHLLRLPGSGLEGVIGWELPFVMFHRKSVSPDP
jgi:hypothetical protein